MALVQQNSGSQTGAGNTIAPALTGVSTSNSLVLVITGGGMADSLPTDSASQTWTKATFSTFNTVNVAIYYLLAPNAGTHTLSWALGSNVDVGVTFDLFEVSKLTAVDVVGSQTTGSGVTIAGQTPSVTTTNAADALFACCTLNANTGSANNHMSNPPSGWTAGTSQNDTAVNYGAGIAYQEVSSTGSKTCAFTFDSANMADAMSMIVAFKQSAGVSAALTAVSSTTSVGSLTAAASKALSAVSSTLGLGSVAAAVSAFISGLTGTGSPGSVTYQGPSLTGVSSSGSVWVVSPAAQLPTSAVTTTSTVGTVKGGVALALTAVSSTTSVGTVGKSVSIGLSGVSTTCSVGNVQAPGLNLTPVSGTGSAGTVAPSLAKAISGISSTSALGSVKSTPTKAISAVSATGSVGSVTFGNVVVALSGNTAIGSPGTLTPPVAPNTKDGERFFAEMMAQPFGYRNLPGPVNKRGAMFFDSGTWTVPLGATNVFVGATARGGTPLGNAGDQALQVQLTPAEPGDILTVEFASNGDLYVFNGAVQLLYLRAGAAYGKVAWQATWGQQSGLPGGFGSGVDAGTPSPPILVFYWN